MVKNALKFTHGGAISVLASYEERDQLLHVHVSDTGTGIEAKDQQRIFEAFETLERTKSMNLEGIGMGLMICKNLVQQNGGTIQVHSDGEGCGSSFKFTMQMQKPKPDPPAARNE